MLAAICSYIALPLLHDSLSLSILRTSRGTGKEHTRHVRRASQVQDAIPTIALLPRLRAPAEFTAESVAIDRMFPSEIGTYNAYPI
jgi:hypothetical protein